MYFSHPPELEKLRLTRWWKLRGASAALLLTVNFRMLINRRRFFRARKGTIRYQALCRGRATRKTLAATKIQRNFRMYTARKNYQKLLSALLSLQCAARSRAALKILTEFKREQKDVGKLKQNNEKLKSEMASLRAMLAAQAKEGQADARNKKELDAKQAEVDRLTKRVEELEHELKEAKLLSEQLEQEMKTQQSKFSREMEEIEKRVRSQPGHRASTVMPEPPRSPQRMRRVSSHPPIMPPLPEGVSGVAVDPEMLAEQRAHVDRLEDQLHLERKLRQDADAEIIKLRAAVNGVKLSDNEVDALMGKQQAQQAAAPEHPKLSDLRYVCSRHRLFCRWFGVACLVYVLEGCFPGSCCPQLSSFERYILHFL